MTEISIACHSIEKTYWIQNQPLDLSLQTVSSPTVPHLNTWHHHPSTIFRWKSQESVISPFPSSPADPPCLVSHPSLSPGHGPSLEAYRSFPTSSPGINCCFLQSILHEAARVLFSRDINHPLPKTHQYFHCSQLLNYTSEPLTLPCLIRSHLSPSPLHSSQPGILPFFWGHRALSSAMSLCKVMSTTSLPNVGKAQPPSAGSSGHSASIQMLTTELAVWTHQASVSPV